VFDEAEQRFTTMSLFPDDRELPADAVDSALMPGPGSVAITLVKAVWCILAV
jgi:hypothetical protein